ncbi:hypothetical protein ILYODFUR_022131 [Ilyodon furcidens]|uniref:Uncharacterized protein n=1 Tax=Ilyodon furcidens TaxID=33524 RepID=A0ABV0V566_9TELE
MCRARMTANDAAEKSEYRGVKTMLVPVLVSGSEMRRSCLWSYICSVFEINRDFADSSFEVKYKTEKTATAKVRYLFEQLTAILSFILTNLRSYGDIHFV